MFDCIELLDDLTTPKAVTCIILSIFKLFLESKKTLEVLFFNHSKSNMKLLLVLLMAACTSAMMAPCPPPPMCKDDQKTCFLPLPMPFNPENCPPAPLCIPAKGKK
jgi:hypothetical protein